MAITKYPPALALDSAVAAIKEIYAEIKTRKVAVSQLPKILKTKPNSSYFPARIAALQKFGFIEKISDDFVELTDSAMMVVNPVHDREDAGAIQGAFMKIDVLATLLSSYPNYVLPSSGQLKDELMKGFGISRETVGDWHDFVVSSFREVGHHYKRQLEVSVSDKVNVAEAVMATLQDYQFSVPVEGGGVIKVLIPKAATARDLKKVKAMIDALMDEEK
jgi:hypothetical protein